MTTTPSGAAREPGAGRRLYLLRHGEAAVAGEAGAADPWQATLTTRGRAEIGDIAEALAGCGLDLLVTSAVPRALETAAILGGRTGLRPAVDEGWNELRAGRVLAGSAKEVRRAIADAYLEAGRPGARFLGGEGFADLTERVDGALGRILAQPGWTRAAVVTHEPALRHLLARCHGLGLGGLSAFGFATGSASVLEWAAEACSADSATVLLMNGMPSDLWRLGGGMLPRSAQPSRSPLDGARK